MSDIHDAITYADLQNFALAVNTKPFNVFYYKTDHALEDVLGPGYFDSVVDASPRKGDRIEVLASWSRLAEYATLAVKDVIVTNSMKHVVVTLLSRSK
jgi:hypothetical protein